jgi:hypothetical protein
MGKGCVRFKKLDDLALDVVGRTVALVRGGTRGQSPGCESAPRKGKDQRAEPSEEGETKEVTVASQTSAGR